jgi:hypothetical protein
MLISILVPTGKRAEKCKRMIESALGNAARPHDVELLLYVADDDPQLDQYKSGSGGELFIGTERHTVWKWNYLYERCSGGLAMLGADDTVFATPKWDDVLRQTAEPFSHLPHVFHFLDSRDPTNTPHPIVTREWCNTLGWFLPPWFKHNYVDTFTCWVAKLTGVFTPIPEVSLIHEKSNEHAGRRAQWTDWDRAEWKVAAPRIEDAMAKVLRATGR